MKQEDIDMLDPADPPSPLTLREAIRAALNELGVPGPEYPAPVANAVYILNAALASSPAPAGLDFAPPLPIEGCECGACAYLRRKQAEYRAATRPAEDGRHKPYGDGYCVCRRPWPCEFATRPAEDAG